MRRRRAPDSFQQARLLFDTAARITGPRPRTIFMPEPTSPTTVVKFTPAYAPLNPRLLDLYDGGSSSIPTIHHCLEGHRIYDGQLAPDMSYFGDNPWREACGGSYLCDEETDCAADQAVAPTFQIEKALELAGKVRELGASLLAADEKGDEEIFRLSPCEPESELLALGLSIRQDQWHAADWQVQALQQTKDVNQTNLIYYTNLYQNGLINDEMQNLTLATNAMQTRTSANIMAAVGGSMTIVPCTFSSAPCPRSPRFRSARNWPACSALSPGSCRRSPTSRAPLPQSTAPQWMGPPLVRVVPSNADPPDRDLQVELQILAAHRNWEC